MNEPTANIIQAGAEEGAGTPPVEGNEPQTPQTPPVEGKPNEVEMVTVEKAHYDEINLNLGREINTRAEAQRDALHYKNQVLEYQNQQNTNANQPAKIEIGNPLDDGFGENIVNSFSEIVDEKITKAINTSNQQNLNREVMKEVTSAQKKHNLTDDQLEILGGVIQRGKAGDIEAAMAVAGIKGTAENNAPPENGHVKRFSLQTPDINRNQPPNVPTQTGNSPDKSASSVMPSQKEMEKYTPVQLKQLEKDTIEGRVAATPENTIFIKN